MSQDVSAVSNDCRRCFWTAKTTAEKQNCAWIKKKKKKHRRRIERGRRGFILEEDEGNVVLCFVWNSEECSSLKSYLLLLLGEGSSCEFVKL